MIVTKSEFRDMFGFKDASSVSHLLKKKTIVANESGMIDLDEKKNKKWVKAREKELAKKEAAQNKEESTESETIPQNSKTENQLGLEIDLLNEKLRERQQKTTLLDLKIAKEKKEVIETDVLNKVIMAVFNTLFQNLSELPGVYVDDIISIIKTDKAPKEAFVKFLTDKILSHIRSSLETAENRVKKYYE